MVKARELTTVVLLERLVVVRVAVSVVRRLKNLFRTCEGERVNIKRPTSPDRHHTYTLTLILALMSPSALLRMSSCETLKEP